MPGEVFVAQAGIGKHSKFVHGAPASDAHIHLAHTAPEFGMFLVLKKDLLLHGAFPVPGRLPQPHNYAKRYYIYAICVL